MIRVPVRALSTLSAVAVLLASIPAVADPTPEQVVLSLEEFLRLYEQGKVPKEPVETAPHDFAVASSIYRGQVVPGENDEAAAMFTARQHVSVLKERGWVGIPLLPTTVALQSARIGRDEAAIVQQDGWYTLVTQRRGSFDVDLTFAVAVDMQDGVTSLSFELPPSGGAQLVLSVPAREALDFTVAGAQVKSDRVVGTERVVEASLPATSSMAVQWQREIPVAEAATPRLYAELYTLVSLGDGLLQSRSTLQYTILQAGVDHLKARIPEGATLVDVTGAGIRDWKTSPSGELDVALNYAAEGVYRLNLQLEQPLGAGSQTVQAPVPSALGVERSKGWIGVEARGNLEIAAAPETSATPIDVRVLPAAILGVTDQPVLLGYKYLGDAARLPLQVSFHQEVEVLVTLLDQADATTMFTADGRRLTSVRYRVRNNRKQFLRLAMPEKAELWSASVAGRPVQPARAGDGRVLIPLVRSQASGGELASFEVGIVYVEGGTPPAPGGTGSFRAVLPTADVPITYVSWAVYTPVQAKVRSKSVHGALRAVPFLSHPFDQGEVRAIQTVNANASQSVEQQAQQQAGGGALGQGAAPVAVAVPLEGRPLFWEKLLALGEELWVSFDYKGLK